MATGISKPRPAPTNPPSDAVSATKTTDQPEPSAAVLARAQRDRREAFRDRERMRADLGKAEAAMRDLRAELGRERVENARLRSLVEHQA